MKFCDKLQKIRKENNITQEGLADKLNVSRQAVSKWESGTAYPDTEKLIAISKLFNISLDELINDSKINDTKTSSRINFKEIFNEAFDFLTKTMNMFWAMKLIDKLKLLLEMFLLILIINIFGNLAIDTICTALRRIFSFIPFDFMDYIIYVINTILSVALIILGGIIIVKVLKTRYLDYYIIITDENITTTKIEEPIPELKAKKEYKVVIRDPKDSSFNIFKMFGKILMFCFKVIALFMLIPAVISFISGIAILVIDLTYVAYGTFFIGVGLSILGGILFAYLIIEFLIKLICEEKLSFKKMFMLFLISLSLIGIGSGIFLKDLASFKLVDNLDNMTNITKEIPMNDRLIFEEIMHLDEKKIVLDNNVDSITIDLAVPDTCFLNIYTNQVYQSDKSYDYTYINTYTDDLKILKKNLNGLKNKEIINSNNCNYEINKVSISKDNFTKLKNNYQKSLG